MPKTYRPRIYRDPIHGDIRYPRDQLQELVAAIIDTETFQRLRNIRQNGVTNLVFHGAEHSRFAHSMGVAHVAARMFDEAMGNSGVASTAADTERARQDTILAALLHDVGHGPFSHLLEEILGRDRFDHEVMTMRIISEPDSEIARLLCAHDPDLPTRLQPFIEYKKRARPRWYDSIVSSQLDADRLDYLARDAYMAGIINGIDLRRLISSLTIAGGQLVIDIRARDVVEDYLLALDQMYVSVYFHKTVRAASVLLSQTIRRAIELARANPERHEELFPRAGTVEDPLWSLIRDGQNISLEVYRTLDEPHVWSLLRRWRGHRDATLSDLASALALHQFPKAIELAADPGDIVRMYSRAVDVFRARYPELNAESYISIDSSSRVSYKVYSVDEGQSGAINFLLRDGSIKAIEALERSIVDVLRSRFRVSRLLVPEWLRDELTG